jgi:hypothetical protein
MMSPSLGRRIPPADATANYSALPNNLTDENYLLDNSTERTRKGVGGYESPFEHHPSAVTGSDWDRAHGYTTPRLSPKGIHHSPIGLCLLFLVVLYDCWTGLIKENSHLARPFAALAVGSGGYLDLLRRILCHFHHSVGL